MNLSTIPFIWDRLDHAEPPVGCDIVPQRSFLAASFFCTQEFGGNGAKKKNEKVDFLHQTPSSGSAGRFYLGRLPLGRFPIVGLTIEVILWPPAWSTAWNWVHRPRLAFWDRLFLAKCQKSGKNQNFLARPVGVQAHFGGSYGQVEYFFGRFFGMFVIICHFLSYFQPPQNAPDPKNDWNGS